MTACCIWLQEVSASSHVQQQQQQRQQEDILPEAAAAPRSPLKLREIDSNVSGPTQQLLAVLHGLQSELDTAGLRQQTVQVSNSCQCPSRFV